jgi:hypothetical protein
MLDIIGKEQNRAQSPGYGFHSCFDFHAAPFA